MGTTPSHNTFLTAILFLALIAGLYLLDQFGIIHLDHGGHSTNWS